MSSGFKTTEVVDGISDKILSFKPVRYVIDNPIMISLTIGIVAFVVVLIIYYDCSSARTFMAIRTGVWVFIISCAIFVLHQHRVDGIINDAKTGLASAPLFQDREDFAGAVPVGPMVQGPTNGPAPVVPAPSGYIAGPTFVPAPGYPPSAVNYGNIAGPQMLASPMAPGQFGYQLAGTPRFQ